jgi:peroxiredoxin
MAIGRIALQSSPGPNRILAESSLDGLVLLEKAICMSANTYNTLTSVILSSALLALIVSAGCFVAAVIGWRGNHRNRRLSRFAAFATMFPVLVVAQYAILQPMFLRSLARERQLATQERLMSMQESIDAVSLVKRGDIAPSFHLTDVDGREFSTDEVRGKVVLLNFFATWCGPCIKELPYVEEIWKTNRHSDKFSLLVIGREETNESVTAFRRQHGFSFPMAADPQCSAYLLYAKKYIPRTFLISGDGKICFASTGFSDADVAALKQELARQLRTSE